MKKLKDLYKKRWFKNILVVLAVIVLAILCVVFVKIKNRVEINRSKQAADLYSQGQDALSSGKYQQSIDELSKANKLRSGDYNTVYSLAMAYYDLKNYSNAEKYYSQAAALPQANKSSIAMIYNNLGNIYRDSGQTDKADAAYKQSFGLDPHLSFPYVNLAVMYYNSGKKDQATAVLEQGVSAMPSASDIANLLKKYRNSH